MLPLLGDDGRTRALAPIGTGPGCAQLPEVRVELWAWNAQMGLMLANGGPQSAAGSLMCQEGVNAKLMRQDDGTKMREDLVTFAKELKDGQAQPKDGTAFVAIMGDGSATFLAETNKVLGKLGPEFKAKVVGSSGYSWGEDKFMGPAGVEAEPERVSWRPGGGRGARRRLEHRPEVARRRTGSATTRTTKRGIPTVSTG